MKTMNEVTGMTGLERCPTCFKLPQITIDDKGPDAVDFIFTCEGQGHLHQAQGQTIEGAKANWNLYVMLSRKAA